jgi:hypothetical protein
VRFSNANTTTDRYRLGGVPALPHTFREPVETRTVVDERVPGATPGPAETVEGADCDGPDELHDAARATVPATTTTRARNDLLHSTDVFHH